MDKDITTESNNEDSTVTSNSEIKEGEDRSFEKRDRRQFNLGPPPGIRERRRGKERRRSRISIGRERYLDMVLKERALFLQQGVIRTTEQLLTVAGAGAEQAASKTEALENATGDQLRAKLPVQAWMPFSIHLISLDNGILKVAPLDEMGDKQKKILKATAIKSGFRVEDIKTELWDRAELIQTLRNVHDLSADRCEKTLGDWLNDIDNGLLLNQFMRDMLAEALQLRASDIHLVQDNASDAPNWIKYRVDGDITPMHLLPSDAMARLTTLIKRDAGLNFGDRTTPKDGRFSFLWQGRAIDVRVAAGPHSQDGEKITLRLLDRANLKSFDTLFSKSPEVDAHLTKLLAPEIKGGGGFILMSGPTGSGKSTTLYACVLEIDRRRRHVLTIEDPIEYEMRYATQWQVEQDNRSFADLIRAAMRHDPDYIVIGEMRDGETVETALKAAESGHTVISTIHADTALQTLERLRSFMPSERERSSTYTLAQQVRMILNQRLIKTLCHSCSYKKMAGEVLEEHKLQALGLSRDDNVKILNASGCSLCSKTGILGRTLLLEVLIIDIPLSKRDPLFRALMSNVNDVLNIPGVSLISRQDSLLKLIKEGAIDPETAFSQLNM